MDSLGRVPQNLSFDTDALYRAYGDQATIIRDIIVFVSTRKMRDLWNNVSFSLDEFCKELGYNKQSLQRTLEEFKNKSKYDLPIIDGHVYDSLFEYSLFRAMRENITFGRKKGDKEIVEVYNIIDRLEINYNKNTNKVTKRTYTIKLNDKILDNLFREYFIIDFDEYRSLKSKKISSIGSYRNFYIYIARMIAQVRYNKKSSKEEHFIISVDDLCRVLDVSITQEPKAKKLQVKRVLDKINSLLNQSKFEFDFVKLNNARAYHVNFIFSQSTIEHFDERLKAVFIQKLYNNCQTEFLKNQNTFASIHQRIQGYKDFDKKEFYKWLESDMDKDLKTAIFISTYEDVYKSSPKEINLKDLPNE